MSLINCAKEYEVDVPGCITTINIDTALEDTAYKCVFILPNGFKLSKSITSGITGIITLTKDDILEGFWNEGTGPVSLQLFIGTDCAPTPITVCDIDYEQIILNFIPIQTEDDTIDIICTCE
jgi:hypothetical protein